MIDTPTLFILGAGASKPYGYPTGFELRVDIIRNFENRLSESLNKSQITGLDYDQHIVLAREFINKFSKSNIYSIDKFLSLNPFFAEIGKLSIVMSILESERQCKFTDDLNPSFNNEDWYSLLFNRMISNCNQPEDFIKFSNNNVSFITFNYDRSLGHFIYEKFLNSFWQSKDNFERNLCEKDCKTIIPFPIIHVYGFVDKNQWHGGFPWKTELHFKKIKSLSNNIKIISERTEIEKNKIEYEITKAKRIFFLGFCYADENLNAINCTDLINQKQRIYGTAKGMTAKEIAAVRSKLTHNFADYLKKNPGNPFIDDRNCYELLRECL
jgi:hypothetical protein